MLSKPRGDFTLGINLLGAWVLGRWQPVYRRRETDLGSYEKLREPVASMSREKPKWKNHEARVPRRRTGTDQSVLAKKLL